MEFFFGDSTPERVAKIVSAGFHVLWQTGCGFIVARESDGDVQGYCIITADEAEVRASFFKNAVWLGFVKDLLRGQIPLRLNEAARLAAAVKSLGLGRLRLYPGANRVVHLQAPQLVWTGEL
ncbi:MAG: hypothetical protein ACM3ZU_00045 [Bacteroidota bacterium]